ncbi:MAG: acyl-CoA/acyl-ACP dehydrogenase [Acetobacter aceti]|uniref:Uncharacterized protein n=1 Tax=Acetobacter aceti TaxID=435 RepID=A0A1U9KHE4_ACEAC|nr:acyl-CoA/acyl-ACP dehydrogenase [Acetobacter aceti]AQS85232.1 hypothetical protein A0U92_11055 [Acetobacter aceti]
MIQLIRFLQTLVLAALGRLLSTLPRFHAVIGEIDGLLLTNRALPDFGLALAATQEMTLAKAGRIRKLVTENAIAVVACAIEVPGNPDLSQDNPLERHYRDVLCGRALLRKRYEATQAGPEREQPFSEAAVWNSQRAVMVSAFKKLSLKIPMKKDVSGGDVTCASEPERNVAASLVTRNSTVNLLQTGSY